MYMRNDSIFLLPSFGVNDVVYPLTLIPRIYTVLVNLSCYVIECRLYAILITAKALKKSINGSKYVVTSYLNELHCFKS